MSGKSQQSADLRAIYPPAAGLAKVKTLARLDKHARTFIANSPFLCIGTANADGDADVSPRGDPAGFVQVLDDRTLLIPDRPGNNRLDTMENIVANAKVGIIFFIPGLEDTLRVNGRARIIDDQTVLAPSAVNRKVPKTGIEVSVDEVFFHCAKALRRSSLWDSSKHKDRKDFPSIVKVILDQTCEVEPPAAEVAAAEVELEADYKKSMY